MEREEKSAKENVRVSPLRYCGSQEQPAAWGGGVERVARTVRVVRDESATGPAGSGDEELLSFSTSLNSWALN